MVLAQELPDVFGGIGFGRIGRQFEQADVVGDLQFSACLMPAGAVEQNDGVAVGCNDAADLGEVQVHRFGVGLGQNQRSADIPRGTDRAEQIGPIVALIARRARPAAPLGPDPGQRPLLADAGFVLPPQFDRFAACVRRDAGCDQSGEVFL